MAASDKLQKAKAELTAFNPRDPQTLLATAQQLKQFVLDNNLSSRIQGRDFVQCEGWQFLFAVAGLDVRITDVYRERDSRPETEICYSAVAELFDASGNVVGYGKALCSSAERSKRTWEEPAIMSMAQTRAIGKTGRNRFAFVMKAAGFEPTPAEEMNEPEAGTGAAVVAESAPTKSAARAEVIGPVSPPPAAPVTSAPTPDAEADEWLAKATVIDALREADTLDELRQLWQGEARPYHHDTDVLAAKEARKQHLEVNQPLR